MRWHWWSLTATLGWLLANLGTAIMQDGSGLLYVMLALDVYLLFQVPKLTQDLPYVAYQPKQAQIAERDRQFIDRAVLWFTLAFLILFAGLRHVMVGLDLSVFYNDAWQRMVATNGNDRTYEWLYTFIAKIGYFVFGADLGLTFVLCVCAAVIVLCVYFVGKRMSPEVGFIMFLMVTCALYLRGFSTIRQCVATALCVLATYWVYRKKPWWFVLCLILASGFHRATGVLFLPLAVFFFIKTDGWQLAVWLEILFLGLVFVHFDHQLVHLFGRVIGNSYYYKYYMQGNYGILNIMLLDYIDTALTWGCFLGFVAYKWWYRWRYKQRVSRQYDLFLNVYFFAALFYVLAYVSPQFYVYERLTVPFSWAGIFLITHIVNHCQNRRLRLVCRTAVIIGALIYQLMFIYFGNHNIIWYDVIR
ncbi:MAG: EpsG family protein [Prevotella sp.]|nr:EpsG family protein [Prevotella sp.]